MPDNHSRLNLHEENSGLPESTLERRWNQARRIAAFVGSLNSQELYQITRSRIIEGAAAERWIPLHHDRLRRPLFVTATKSDLSIYAEVVVRDEYHLPADVSEAIDGQPIVDIGGNIGAAATLFASRYMNSPVFSIEPNARNFELLNTNAELYADQITTANVAFAVEPGMVSLANPEVLKINGHSLYRYDNEGEESDELVQAIAPDEILEAVGDKIGLLKMDIEGAEIQLASPAVDRLLSAAGVMIVEAHDVFKPGASAAVRQAAARNGHALIKVGERNKRVLFFSRSQ